MKQRTPASLYSYNMNSREALQARPPPPIRPVKQRTPASLYSYSINSREALQVRPPPPTPSENARLRYPPA